MCLSLYICISTILQFSFELQKYLYCKTGCSVPLRFFGQSFIMDG